MAFASFRDWVNALERAGELVRIREPLATELEITELADREMKKPGGGKALLIEQPTVNGVVSPFPVAINTLGSHKRMALSMGSETVDDVARELGALLKAKPPTGFRETVKLLGTALDLRHAKPKLVKDGPCKEVVHRFDAPPARTEPWPAAKRIAERQSPIADSRAPIADRQSPIAQAPIAQAPIAQAPIAQAGDSSAAGYERLAVASPPTLLNLPILKCWPLDGGRFITLPCVVTKDPDTGERNVGMYRIQIYDDRTTGMHWQLQKVGARHGRRYYETGTRMPVADFSRRRSRCSPFAATAPLPDGLDEFLLAGYLRKKSVELVKCETNDLEVPANSDIRHRRLR